MGNGRSELGSYSTGCYYSLPQIRMCPKYPSLAHDIRSKPAGSRRKLTGGIMAVWCTHVSSYGFHCIPVGEGKNDVFLSYLYPMTQSSKIHYIAYDFACALGPYCMTYEPDYFADSTIVIDGFHAPDHTKCDESSFLSSYVAVDSCLHRLNSSAAECGNGGLKRIRKVVQYLGQERVMIYTHVFLAVWNRAQIRKLLHIDDY
ncbi:hypothetical protein BDZ94DRAFT_1290643 [Collybia nuda]|uniref:Uncharacterized protein n=1 Tax=Collybia nuda TaxID=64659 RepID=A0A9P5Y3Q0_9AGAR|nr:hypothetical protein BDZ94DRAFT_1290643 [Collybia nuda]